MSSLKFCVLVFIFKCVPYNLGFIVVPEDVSTGLAAIYGFTPRVVFGGDHRFGFGFKFGNHADLQVVYELGPQELTKPLRSSSRIRSAAYRQRIVRRRPFIEFLIRAGLLDLKEEAVEFNVVKNGGYEYDEPR